MNPAILGIILLNFNSLWHHIYNYYCSTIKCKHPESQTMSLKLSKPLAVIDLETTGINLASDRIVEIAIIKILTDGTRHVKRKLLNPEIPIPKASSDLHGITNEMVKDAPTFKQVANEIKQFLENCDLAGYNSNKFDIPVLVEEFYRAGIDFKFESRKMVDVQKIFYQMEPRTLSAA